MDVLYDSTRSPALSQIADSALGPVISHPFLSHGHLLSPKLRTAGLELDLYSLGNGELQVESKTTSWKDHIINYEPEVHIRALQASSCVALNEYLCTSIFSLFENGGTTAPISQVTC